MRCSRSTRVSPMRCRSLSGSVARPERNEQRSLLNARAELVYCLGPPKGGHPMKRALFWLATIGLAVSRSEEHTSELQSRLHLVCRLLLEKKKKKSQK